jgi:hypothetical protein
VTETVRALLEDIDVNELDWPMIAKLAGMYLLSLLPTKAAASPHSLLSASRQVQKLDHLCKPGCSAHVKLPDHDREPGKLDAESVEGVLVGFDEPE